jgi:creatinine amidohydrolase/Fe(II)-dependent formamide hydrolase-like protein
MAGNFQHWGFKTVVCINGNGDNIHRRILEESVNYIRSSNNYDIVNVENLQIESTTDGIVNAEFTGTDSLPDYHSPADETEKMWPFFPTLVNHKKVKKNSYESFFNSLGYVNEPSQFDKCNGNTILNRIADNYSQRIINYVKEIM